MNNELKNLLEEQTKILSPLMKNIAILHVKIDKIEDNLDYRKHVVYFGHSPTSKLS